MLTCSSRKEVLVVDDNSLFRRSLCKALTARGFVCHEAADAGSALDELGEGYIGYIVTDYHMPDMTGLEFLKILSEKLQPRLPVSILVTSDVNDVLKRKALHAGAIDVVEKTCDFTSLVEKVLKILERTSHV